MKQKIMNSTILINETGRSMVEMLGVLSIIGVLSVGGISAYTIAMEKHKANELLQQASMLATTISAQAMTNNGTLPLTITSFGNTNYGTFSTTVTDALGGKGFTITISELDGSVCSQLKKGGMVQNVDCNPDAKTATITYYKNLAITQAEGEKSPTGTTTEPVDPACADVKCDDGLSCVNGSCLCSDGMLPCKGACCGEGKICTAPGTGDSSRYGECVTPTGECVTNADCGKNEFCLFESYTSASDDGTTCEVPANGVCTALTGSYAKKVVENTEEPLYGVTYCEAEMNWWSASNWCQANGSSLMSQATLNTLSGLSATAYNETDSKTARKTALQGGLGETTNPVWLEGANSGVSCTARIVFRGTGSILYNPRSSSYYALCR